MQPTLIRACPPVEPTPPVNRPMAIPNGNPWSTNLMDPARRFPPYEDAAKALRAWGFVPWVGAEAPLSSAPYETASGPAKRGELWAHPGGPVVYLDLSRFGVSENPVEWRLNAFRVHACVDIGASSEHCRLLRDRLRLVTFEPRSDGAGGQWLPLEKRSSEGIGELHGFLLSLEKWGRVMGFQEWARRLPVGKPWLVLSDEFVGGVRLGQQGATRKHSEEKATEGSESTKKALELLVQHSPFEVAPIASGLGSVDRLDPDVSPFRTLEKRGHACQDLLSDVLFLSGARWPKETDAALVSRWIDVALGNAGEDPETWGVEQEGPGGLSLPAVLLYASNLPGNCQRFKSAVAAASAATRKKWAQEADVTGLTLAGHAVRCALSPRFGWTAADGPSATAPALLNAWLCASPIPVVVNSPCRNPLGLVLEVRPADLGEAEVAAYQACLALLEGAGVEWDAAPRWRDPAEEFMGPDDRKGYLGWEGPQWREAWKNKASPLLSRTAPGRWVLQHVGLGAVDLADALPRRPRM